MKKNIKIIFLPLLMVLLMVMAVGCGDSTMASVSFIAGTNATVTPRYQTVVKGELVTKPEAYKENHTLVGWYLSTEYSTEWDFDSDIVTESIKLYAKWQNDNPAYISFDTDDGNEISRVEIIDGKIILPTNPTKDGYKFVGWYIDSNFEEVFVNRNLINDQTIYAKWIEVPTISFNTDGGNIIDPIVIVNGKIALPANPTKEGYKFTGWYLDGDYQEVFNNKNLTTSQTIYAKWDQIFYISFSGDSIDLEPKAINDGSIVMPDIPTKEGYRFDGWYLDSQYTEEFVNEDLTESITIYAKWNRIFYISFDTDGGNEIEPKAITDGTIIMPDIPTKEEYRFAGWYLDQEYSEEFVNENLTESITIYAKWDQIFYISFDTDGGNEIEPIEINGGIIVMPNIPVKEGYRFEGWFTNLDLDEEFVNENLIINQFVYAKWYQLQTFYVTFDGTDYPVFEGGLFPEILYSAPLGKIFIGWKTVSGDQINLEQPITSSFEVEPILIDAPVYKLIFETNGGSAINELPFYENQEIVLPDDPVKVDNSFVGWYLDELLQQPFDLVILTEDTTIYAKWISTNIAQYNVLSGAYSESLWATWQDSDAAEAAVYYSVAAQNNWKNVDQPLIRKMGNDYGRVDIVGLKEGHYDIKIITKNNAELLVENVYTQAHDRSGYAHFNYTSGIGAYKDDGTLKDNAIVVYVTEQNKNTITVPGLTAVGLGNILNNNTHSSGTHLGKFNTPIVFRIIGKVTAPTGLTVPDGTDNGFMARIKDGVNISIQGIGEDSELYGWGIHYIASSSNRGNSFEVTNLTFRHYPEDAIGVEGKQSGTTLTVPVERIWVHHNTFYAGYCEKPKEDDKKEGDGSLDAKRGQYLTYSYNRFDGAHKTNLIGSDDEALTFHMTMHHNLWTNCASRVPLARQVNLHMYNNVFEATDDNTNSMSYAQNTRAYAYIFSESNYFYGITNPSRVGYDSSTLPPGAIKSFDDVKYSTSGIYDNAVVVTNRETLVASGNRFENFDTNSAIFYYDSVNKRSNVKHLTDAITARMEVYSYAGTYNASRMFELDDIKVSNALPTLITEDIDFGTTSIKKNQPFLVFEVKNEVIVNLASTHSTPPVLVNIYGKRIITGNGTATLQPGIYILESSISHGAGSGSSYAKDSGFNSFILRFN